jgi:hypothetical protein
MDVAYTHINRGNPCYFVVNDPERSICHANKTISYRWVQLCTPNSLGVVEGGG